MYDESKTLTGNRNESLQKKKKREMSVWLHEYAKKVDKLENKKLTFW